MTFAGRSRHGKVGLGAAVEVKTAGYHVSYGIEGDTSPRLELSSSLRHLDVAMKDRKQRQR